MTTINIHADYRQVLGDIKQRIQTTHMRVTLAVNRELLDLYPSDFKTLEF